MALSPVLAQAIMQQAQGPDLVGSFLQGQQVSQQREERDFQQGERDRQVELRDVLGQAYAGKKGAMERYGSLDPQAAMQLQQAMGARDQAEMDKTFQDMAIARNLTGNARKTFLLNRMKRGVLRGEGMDKTAAILDMSEAEQNAEFDSLTKAGQAIGKLPKPEKIAKPTLMKKGKDEQIFNSDGLLVANFSNKANPVIDLDGLLNGYSEQAVTGAKTLLNAYENPQEGLNAALKRADKIETDIVKAAEADAKQTTITSESLNAISFIDDIILGDADLIYGSKELPLGWFRSEAGKDMMAKRDNIGSLLELAAAGKMKGQGTITGPEREILRQAATVLKNDNISPEMAEQELMRVRPIFSKMAVGAEIPAAPTLMHQSQASTNGPKFLGFE
jgi:hypothetical protein